ncbi:MAG: alpha amylase N-terminal ig-like domain-containing protein [Candidatus Eisenbacteria bacterium]
MSDQQSRAVGLLIAVLFVLIAGSAIALAGDEADSTGSSLKEVIFTFSPLSYYDEVFLAGTFNGWSTDATPMRRIDRRFEVMLLLPEGEYPYKFVADGNWITDERAARFQPDGYGGRNSVIDVDDSFEAIVLVRGDGRMMLDGLDHRDNAWERSLNADSTVTLRVRAWMGDIEHVIIHWLNTCDLPEDDLFWSRERSDTLERFDSDGKYDYYEATLPATDLVYYFEIVDGGTEVVLDRLGARIAGPADLRLFRFDSSTVTAFATPDWVRDAVIYQIFPERFANGSPGNDPDFSEWYYEGLAELPASGKTNGEYFHMIDDWYDTAGLTRSPYKTDGKPDWNSFYGGDIEGIRKNLDYLEDLGVTAIYFNPVFEAKSNHKYDAATFMKIDPHFATNDEFAGFVTECHGRGIRIILDLAFNHTGHTYWAFLDARQKGSESAYWDWYEWKKWPLPGSNVSTPGDALEYYDCWWGFGQMPNLNFDLSKPGPEEHTVTEIDDAEPNWPLVDHLLKVTEFWLSEMDVDGYRLDVANEVPLWFWELFRKRVKDTKPDAYIVGELWGSSPEWVNGRYFDAVMNYEFFRSPVLAFIAKGSISAEEFDTALAPGRLIYLEPGVRAMMNLLGSHDTQRFLTEADGDIRRLKLAMLFAMTYVGAPTIYYGDEIAMAGAGDPVCRRPFHWKWPDETRRLEVHDHVSRLATLRRQHPCFTRGGFEKIIAEGPVYAFRRTGPGGDAIVVMNAGPDEVTVEVPLEPGVLRVEDALAYKSIPATAGGPDPLFRVTLDPVSGSVFLPVAE